MSLREVDPTYLQEMSFIHMDQKSDLTSGGVKKYQSVDPETRICNQ